MLLAVLAKADPSTTGRIRGSRHVMLADSDINATRLRALWSAACSRRGGAD